jgi:6-pyruvoyltetrahydropterin/6-carboxytetrahydropterin synthase
MTVELEGDPDARGMVVDFKEMKAMVKPLVDEWDHSVMADHRDTELIESVKKLGSKLSILPCDTTAENVCIVAIDRILEAGKVRLNELGIHGITVRVRETVTSYAEMSVAV